MSTALLNGRDNATDNMETPVLTYDPSKLPIALLTAAQALISVTPPLLLVTSQANLNSPTLTIAGATINVYPIILRFIINAAAQATAERADADLLGSTAQASLLVDQTLSLVPLLTDKSTLTKYTSVLDEHLTSRTYLR